MHSRQVQPQDILSYTERKAFQDSVLGQTLETGVRNLWDSVSRENGLDSAVALSYIVEVLFNR